MGQEFNKSNVGPTISNVFLCFGKHLSGNPLMSWILHTFEIQAQSLKLYIIILLGSELEYTRGFWTSNLKGPNKGL